MKSTVADWRLAADPEDLREYDRFGPWIDRVVEAIDMPRRFRPWWDELAHAEHLLKVPRAYDRAQVRPGMDLYRSVIAVLPDRLCILTAESDQVRRRDVARAEVVGSIQHTNLLVGRWTLLLADGDRVAVEFSSTSQATIAEVDADLLRAVQPQQRPDAAVSGLRPANHLYGSILAQLRAHSGVPVRAIHVEEPDQPCRYQRWRRRSSGVMFMATGDDLIVLNRSMDVQPRFGRANYAYDLVRIPFRRITNAELRSPEPCSPPGFHRLVVTCGRQEVSQACLLRPDAVIAVLAEQGIGTQC